MKRLFADLIKVEKFFKQKQVMIFLDYDGTLTPIVATPERANLSKVMRKVLERLSKKPGYRLAIVSGRALADVRKRVGIKGITYVGNHGFEVDGPDVCFRNRMPPKVQKVFQQLYAQLRAAFQGLPGVAIEDKGETFSVHYRQVAGKHRHLFEKVFDQVVRPYVSVRAIRLGQGKKVYEIYPPAAMNKGKVVQWLLKSYRQNSGNKKTGAVYIGDDQTDEYAFQALRAQALTVRVGKGRNSAAHYYVDGVQQVRDFLSRISALKESGHARGS